MCAIPLKKLMTLAEKNFIFPEVCLYVCMFCLHKNFSFSCRAYKNLKSLIAVDPSIKTKLCIDGPYDTGLWRLGCRPTLPQGVSAEVMLDFIKVCNSISIPSSVILSLPNRISL